jgi:hypothetical protein
MGRLPDGDLNFLHRSERGQLMLAHQPLTPNGPLQPDVKTNAQPLDRPNDTEPLIQGPPPKSADLDGLDGGLAMVAANQTPIEHPVPRLAQRIPCAGVVPLACFQLQFR